ncbi:hypothetical protein FRC02_007093, partial [Tulasnella sp. 418]
MLLFSSSGSSKSKAKNKNLAGVASATAVTTLTIVKESLDGVPVPGLKNAVGGLLEIIKAVKKTHENTQDLRDLDTHINDLNEILTSVYEEKSTGLPPALIDQTSRLSADIEKIVESSGDLRSQSLVLRFLTHHDDAAAIIGLNRSLEQAIIRFQIGSSISVHQGVSRIERRIERVLAPRDDSDPFTLLRSYAQDARYDSTSGRATISRCFTGTRSDLLEEIFNWATDPNAKAIYWLCGRAGTGKSTIAQTVAEALHQRQILGATFFFSRDAAERSNALFVFPTLAYQLARFRDSFRSRIVASVSKNPDSLSSMLQTQLETLITDPLRDVDDAPSTVVLVIDALDECADEDLVQEMLVLLSSSIPKLPFHMKIFITSRPDTHIRSKFDEPSMKLISEASLLHDIDISVVQNDIKLYLDHHLHWIGKEVLGDKTWPSSEELNGLVERANGLFVYAASSIAYIGDKTARIPKQRLTSLLADKPPDGKSPFAQIDGLYRHILGASLPRAGSSGMAQRLQSILGAIVVLIDPLPAHAIESLISLQAGTIRPMVDALHSVLSVPVEPDEPLRVFHQSFPDFMIDPNRCTNLRLLVEPKIHHSLLALQCLKLMNSSLERNICRVNDPFILNADIPNLAQTLDSSIEPHLKYACRFWALHLKHADPDDQPLREALTTFVTTKLLYWLEVLSLTQHLDSAITSLNVAHTWYQEEESKRLRLVRKMIPVSEQFSILEEQLRSREEKLIRTKMPVPSLLHECQRFVLRFFDHISKSANHIYHSSLPFTPRSLLYQQFSTELKDVVRVSPTESTWDPTLAIMQGHSGTVWSVCFSPDGSKIASGSSDCTVYLRDSSTGTHTKTLKGHSQSVHSVCFSPDGTKIASGSGDLSIRIWDLVTGTCIKTLNGHTQSVWSVYFSPDGSSLVSGSGDCSVRLWNVETGVMMKTLEGHTRSVSSVCFSPDGLRVASASDDSTVRLWNLARETHTTMKGHTQAVRSVCFSPDGTRLASGSSDRTVRLWDCATGACTKTLERHSSSVWAVHFLCDGVRIATGSGDHSIGLWNSVTGSHIRTLAGHSGAVRSVSFSPDGTRLISGSSDYTVHLWDHNAGMHAKKVQQHSGPIQSMCFSPDGSKLTSASDDHNICLWNPSTAALNRTLRGHSAPVYALCFSPDGTSIASGSGDNTVMLWNSTSGALPRSFEGHTRAVRSVCFSSDGSKIASGSDDCKVHVWDRIQGGYVSLVGHSQAVNSVCFSPDGTSVASGSADLTVCLWDSVTGSLLTTMKGHSASVKAVCFLPSDDGLRVISGSEDHTLRLWSFDGTH